MYHFLKWNVEIVFVLFTWTFACTVHGEPCSFEHSETGCSSCAPGMSFNVSTQDCEMCEWGKYSNLSSYDCIPCYEGTYSDAGASTCLPCAAGTFSTCLAAISSSICMACTKGKYSSLGSSSCLNCSAGTFSSSAGASACTQCPAHEYSPGPGATGCLACVPGKYTVSVAYTINLQPTTWDDANQLCTDQGGHLATITSQEQNNEVMSLAAYLDDSGDLMNYSYYSYYDRSYLWLGYMWMPQSESWEWVSGSESQFTNWDPYSPFDPLDYGYTAILTFNTQSEGLPPGSWSNWPWWSEFGYICQKESSTGASLCTDCPAGTFMDMNNTETNCQMCVPGKFSNSNSSVDCQYCSIGTYAQQPGSSKCLSCPHGSISSIEGASNCSKCSAGQYSESGGSMCLVCGPGKYSAATDITIQVFQEFATWQEASLSCIAQGGALASVGSMDQNEFLVQWILSRYGDHPGDDLVGGYSAWDLFMWIGFSCNEGISYCSWTSGLQSNFTNVVQYTEVEVQGENCAAIRIFVNESDDSDIGAWSFFNCSTQRPYICMFDTPSGPASCELCGAGSWSSETASSVCINCAAGKFATAQGATVMSTCYDCSAGRYAYSGSTACNLCSPGTFSENNGSISCSACLSGTYTSGFGATECGQCEHFMLFSPFQYFLVYQEVTTWFDAGESCKDQGGLLARIDWTVESDYLASLLSGLDISGAAYAWIDFATDRRLIWENACDTYDNSSTRISVDCILKLWQEAGCTNQTSVLEVREWWEYSSLSEISEEIGMFASSDDPNSQVKCYVQRIVHHGFSGMSIKGLARLWLHKPISAL